MTISKMYGTAVFLFFIFPDHLPCFHGDVAGPFSYFSAVVILSKAGETKNSIHLHISASRVRRRLPRLSRAVASAEKHKNPIGASGIFLIGGRNPVPEGDYLVGRRTRLDRNGLNAGLPRIQFFPEQQADYSKDKMHEESIPLSTIIIIVIFILIQHKDSANKDQLCLISFFPDLRR